MAISNTLVTNTPTAVYTVPTGQEFAVTTMFFCNYSASDVTLSSLNLVPSGGTASDTNRIIKDLLVPAGETLTFDSEKIILGSQDFISAVASDNSRLNVTFCTLQVS
jgi:hypothetical protein